MTIKFIHPYLSYAPLPLLNARVQAGFPSPADDWLEETLDLNEHLIEHLIEHPAATFFARVQGESMIDAGVHEGDLLVIDRAVKAKSYDLVVCVLDGDFTLKRIVFKAGGVALVPANKDFPVMHVQPHQDFEVWGVVKHVIHSV